jgi:hypothetical protein
MSVILEDNIMLMSDSYKAGHAKCYPKGMSRLY